jgi:hypothetical protein
VVLLGCPRKNRIEMLLEFIGRKEKRVLILTVMTKSGAQFNE